MAERQVLVKFEIFNCATEVRQYDFNIKIGEKSHRFSALLNRPIADETGFLCDYDAHVESLTVSGDKGCVWLTMEEAAFFRELLLEVAYEFEIPDSFEETENFERYCKEENLQRFL